MHLGRPVGVTRAAEAVRGVPLFFGLLVFFCYINYEKWLKWKKFKLHIQEPFVYLFHPIPMNQMLEYEDGSKSFIYRSRMIWTIWSSLSKSIILRTHPASRCEWSYIKGTFRGRGFRQQQHRDLGRWRGLVSDWPVRLMSQRKAGCPGPPSLEAHTHNHVIPPASWAPCWCRWIVCAFCITYRRHGRFTETTWHGERRRFMDTFHINPEVKQQ